jgi:hypothetical protein
VPHSHGDVTVLEALDHESLLTDVAAARQRSAGGEDARRKE